MSVTFAGVPDDGKHDRTTTLKKDHLFLHLVAQADDYLQRYALGINVNHLKDPKLTIANDNEATPTHQLVLTATHAAEGTPYTLKWQLDPERVVWNAGVSAQIDKSTGMLLVYLPKVHDADQEEIEIHVQEDLAAKEDEEAEMEES